MAAGLSFSGLGSGIDFAAVTDSIIAQRGRPINQLQTRKANLNSRVDALKQLNAKLITMTDASRALTDRTLGTGRVATSSISTIVSATTTDAAALGTTSVNVTRLATNFSQTSRDFAAANSPVLTNNLLPATFELREGGAATGPSITIDSSNNTLTGLRDAINSANAGVTATIVDVSGDGTQNKLVLTSKETGAANRVELVETTSPASNSNLGMSGLNPPGPVPDLSTLDASLTVNGLAIMRPTNTISNAVTGITFDLKSVGAANVEISANQTALGDKVKAFVDAYNAVQDFVSAQYAKDGAGRPSGVLAGDPTLRAAQRQLNEAMASSSTTNGGPLENLTQIGIGRDSNNKLTLNRTMLDDKLKTSFGDVQALFSGKTTGQTGLANAIFNASNALSDNITGVVQNGITGYTSSVKNIEKSITAQQDRLELLRASLSRQFAAADAAISLLNGQGTALTSTMKSLQSND